MSRIAVIGAGYVGLTTGACFAHLGHDVVCADVVPEKIARLNRGQIPIVEGGLENLVADGLRSGRLHFVVGAVTAETPPLLFSLFAASAYRIVSFPHIAFRESAAAREQVHPALRASG